jgi:hypothetical protein
MLNAHVVNSTSPILSLAQKRHDIADGGTTSFG